MRLRSDDSFLLVVDMQAQLAPHVDGGQRVVTKCAALIETARRLGLPIRVTEHCADRIGASVSEIAALLEPGEILSKTHFCCTDEPGVLPKLQALGRRQAVIAGMEAHVCAMQAALGLVDQGYQCFFVQDAAGSRRASDHAAAVERLRAIGVQIVTAEMVMFEWLKRADTPQFRDLLPIIKSI